MSNITWGSYITDKLNNPLNTTVACAGAASSVGWWLYNRLITDPLRTFYFTGGWWGNAPKSEICFRITGVESKWWTATDDHMRECVALTEREFQSWDATIMTVLYFTVLTFGVLQMVCQCCVIKPIIKAIRQPIK